MKILVTGGAGFIGSEVVRQAIGQGHSVANLDALTYAANLANLVSVADSPAYSFFHCDIRDANAVKAVFEQVQPEAVIHLAAESHVDRSIGGPEDFITTNVNGSYNLLEAARSHWFAAGKPDAFRFLHVSTDEVFGSLPDDPSAKFSEDSAYAPRSPYSASKAASDHLMRAWHATFDLPVVISNCSNNYGPYQLPEKLVPVVILKALAGEKIPVYGTGKQVRDWLHVSDHANALLHVLAAGTCGESYNIGARGEMENIDLVRMICRLLDSKQPRKTGHYEEQIEHVVDRPGHDARYAIEPGKIEQQLGWKAAISLKQGMDDTVQWYLDNEEWWRPYLERDYAGRRLGIIS